MPRRGESRISPRIVLARPFLRRQQGIPAQPTTGIVVLLKVVGLHSYGLTPQPPQPKRTKYQRSGKNAGFLLAFWLFSVGVSSVAENWQT